MNNWEIAQELKEIKNCLELKEERELASIFEQSYYTVLTLDFPLKDYNEFYFLPEVVAKETSNILSLGYSPLKDNLRKQIPKGLRTIYELPELRPENALKIYEILNVESINDLKKYVFAGKLRTKPEFGKRFEDQLKRSILNYENNRTELTLFEAISYANSIKLTLKGNLKIEVAGSVRRGKETVTNLDFVVGGEIENVKKEIQRQIGLSLLRIQDNIIIARDKNNYELKFHVVPVQYFYSALQYYTGSKSHNNEISQIAKAKKIDTLKEGYLKVHVKTEEELYNILGLQYVPPEIREGNVEIELALKRDLPTLVAIEDIKGDLHVHSNFSDGLNTIDELKEEASYLKYEYLAITDHSQLLYHAHGLSKERLLKQMEIIYRINKLNEGLLLLKGIESDITDEGKLDIDEEEMKKLDIIIGALHNFSQDKYKNTFRVKNAIKQGVSILAHPTGRIYRVRPPIPLDIEEIINESIKYGVALEINLFPNRMDLSSELIKLARKNGLKRFAAGTDAHNLGHLSFMKFGIKILRRAWIEPKELLNTYNRSEIKEELWTMKH